MNVLLTIGKLFQGLKLQMLGVLNIGVMLGIVWVLFPVFMATLFGKIICSLAVGAYLYRMHSKASWNFVNGLQFSPSGENLEQFNELIRSCNVDPQTIKLRYMYTDTALAMATYNCVGIDPMLWVSLEQDPQALEALKVIDRYISPNIAEHARLRLQKIKAAMTTAVQNFIFRHEVGHVIQNYSQQKLFVIGFVGFVSSFIGISVAVAASSWGYWAFMLGVVVGGLADIVISYASNLLFKLAQEKKADAFAVRHSLPQEVQAAAEFFKEHQKIVDAHQESDNILALLPMQILSGHQDGMSRAHYILSLKGRSF